MDVAAVIVVAVASRAAAAAAGPVTGLGDRLLVRLLRPLPGLGPLRQTQLSSQYRTSDVVVVVVVVGAVVVDSGGGRTTTADDVFETRPCRLHDCDAAGAHNGTAGRDSDGSPLQQRQAAAAATAAAVTVVAAKITSAVVVRVMHSGSVFIGNNNILNIITYSPKNYGRGSATAAFRTACRRGRRRPNAADGR